MTETDFENFPETIDWIAIKETSDQSMYESNLRYEAVRIFSTVEIIDGEEVVKDFVEAVALLNKRLATRNTKAFI